MSDPRILFVQLQEFALLEEQDRVEVVLLDLPELLLERRKLVPRALRDIQRPRVVPRLPRTHAVLVAHVDEEAKGVLGGLLLRLLLESALLGCGEECAAASWPWVGGGFLL